MKILIFHDNVSDKATPDEIDTLIEAQSVHKISHELDHVPILVNVDNDLNKLKDDIVKNEPDLIANLVESFNGSGKMSYKVPTLLEKMQIPFTGESSKAIKITTDKIATKQILIENKILTPDVIFPSARTTKIKKRKYIIKPIWEDASLGINDNSIVEINDKDDLDLLINNRKHLSRGEYFIEEFIDGREWNLSIINIDKEPTLLPPAEILFKDFKANLPKILNYSAKWDQQSIEYQNTVRNFNHDPKDFELISEMEMITLKCWSIFELKNYARIDFRVNEQGIPYVLEINANPCISPDAGLAAAAAIKGINYKSLINLILENSKI